jgi:diamine N-acetyltransferase
VTSPEWPPSLGGNFTRQSHPEFCQEVESAAMKNQIGPIGRDSKVSLREITRDTVRAISLLDVGVGQDGLVAPNAVSIAQAHFAPDAWFRAIYADETPVGFAMLEDHSLVTDREPPLHEGAEYVALWRFMIDARYQKFGFGAQAIDLLIAHARTRPKARNMLLSFVPKENNPEAFYKRFGFERTGEIDDGEVVMRLALR